MREELKSDKLFGPPLAKKWWGPKLEMCLW